jgi:DNA repair protein RadC
MKSPGVSAEGHRSRLRARFEKTGFNGFAEHEILELLLTLCIPRKDVKNLAKELLQHFGQLKQVLDAPIDTLKTFHGMGEAASIGLHIIRQAAALYLQENLEDTPILNSIDKLCHFWRVRISHLKNEVFEVAFLDKRYGLIHNGIERMQEGDIDRAVVYPRRILSAALKHNAAALVIAHNHPVGLAHPSEEDRILTQALIQATHSIGIPIIDHIIVAPNHHFSFRRSGLIATEPQSTLMAALS